MSPGAGRSGGASASGGALRPGRMTRVPKARAPREADPPRGPGRPGAELSPAAARASQISANAPAAAPTRVGTTYPAVAVGLVTAAPRAIEPEDRNPPQAEGQPPDREHPDHRGV